MLFSSLHRATALSAARPHHIYLYTLILCPDITFEVFIDNKPVRDGKLDAGFDFLADKKLKNPNQYRVLVECLDVIRGSASGRSFETACTLRKKPR